MESRFKIVSNEYDGSLCHEAELFLHNDIESERVGLINDTFIMKDMGAHAMVAVESLEVEGGTIEPGFWYEIDWYVLSSNIYHRIHYYGQRIHVPGVVEIKRMRSVRERTGLVTRSELLKMSADAAKKLSKLAITEIEQPLPYPPHRYSQAWLHG